MHIPGNVGLTAIHSMTYGTPVCTHSNLCTQMPEVESIIDGITGCFFQENDVQGLAHTIKKWLNNKLDSNLIKQNCYTIVDNTYNPENQLHIMSKILNDE